MKTSYFELTVTPSESPELFIDFINEIFPEPVEEYENSFILRYHEDFFEDIIWAIEAFVSALNKSLDKEVKVTFTKDKKENIDWIKEYQEGVAPIEVGNFYIHPSWNEPMEGKNNIVIDPALAFGSGHHPTTATCLKAIDSYVNRGSSVVDVGCGSGILAIACAKKEALVDLCDTDIESLISSKENFEKNGVTYENIWEGSIGAAPRKYDVIVANIVADVLTFIANDIFKKLNPNGVVILSGILDKYEDKVIQSYRKFNLIERITEAEWVTLVLTQKENNE